MEVDDQLSGAAVCNASVVLSNASETYKLTAPPLKNGDTRCLYQPASYHAVPAGSYSVDVSAPGYKAATVQDVVVHEADGQPCVPFTYGGVSVKLVRN